MAVEGETPGQGGSAAGGADIQPLEEDDPAILGSYTLLGRLATGGMGRIFLARSVRDGSLAAVKTLLAEGEVDGTDRRRFAREVKVARRAEGVRTARVLDADPEAPRPWMATEYVPAPSVAELVRRAGPLSGTAARWVTRGALESLAELHRQDIVHRDVKPQNMLLELAGPRLIDFGISHATDLTRTRLTLGTLAYIAPEQARGEPATPACDVYALGATLCTLATGRPPYPDTGDPVRLLALVARGAVELGGVPDVLLGLVRACLSPDPAARPRPAALRALAEETGAAAAAASAGGTGGTGGSSWSGMPDRWAWIVLAYQRQGRELTQRYGSTGPVPPSGEGLRPGAAAAAGPASVADPDPGVPVAEAAATAPQATAPRTPTETVDAVAAGADARAPHPAPGGPAPDPAPDPGPARRVAGLTPRGWRAAVSVVGNCAGIGFLALGALAVLATVIGIVVAIAAG